MTLSYEKSADLGRLDDAYSLGDVVQVMGQVRQAIQRRYGDGTQTVRKTEPVGDVVQTIVGYKWNQNNCAIELYYYAAQNGPNVFRTISVHYKSY